MESLLTALRAAGEQTRLRLLAVLVHGELTVKELTNVLGQSQPRISRHLKLMTESGLIVRYPEGSWVFYRIAETGQSAKLARDLIALMPQDDRFSFVILSVWLVCGRNAHKSHKIIFPKTRPIGGSCVPCIFLKRP